jgi:hypothetical protein
MIADNRKLWVRGVGSIKIRCWIDNNWKHSTFQYVLSVPELRKNLFSMGQAANKGFVTTYTRTTCYLTSKEGRGSVVISGAREQKFYRLVVRVDKPQNGANVAVSAGIPQSPDQRPQVRRGATSTTAKQLMLWHQRFGHANNAMIINMHTNASVNGLHLTNHALPENSCKGCAIRKSARCPFPKQRASPRAVGLGLFFHADVCGPMSQESFGKSRYFVLFKDDFSGYRIVFYIRNKSDVLACIKSLCATVQQETRNKIEKLRSDRGGEFTGTEVTEFLTSLGIRHELTCPYTLEQNGSAERENRTIVESIRSMLHAKQLGLQKP